MSETTTMTTAAPPQQHLPQPQNLNLRALKTVLWLETNPLVEDVSTFTKKHTDKARQYKIIEAVFVIVLFQLSWLFTLVHTVPWPAWSIQILHKVDHVVEGSLDTVYTRLEWWWDYITIHIMRAVETLVIYLDKFITFADNVIAWLIQKYDWVFDIATRAFATAKGLFLWCTDILRSTWQFITNLITNLQQMWNTSQEKKKLH